MALIATLGIAMIGLQGPFQHLAATATGQTPAFGRLADALTRYYQWAYSTDQSGSWRWLDTSEYDCTDRSAVRCWGVEVIAPSQGCRTLHVAAETKDLAGKPLATLSAVTTDVLPNQRVFVILNVHDGAVAAGSSAPKIRCST